MLEHAEKAGEPHALAGHDANPVRRTLVVDRQETFREAVALIRGQIDAAILLGDRKRAHVLGCILGSLIATEKLCGFAASPLVPAAQPAGPVVSRMLALRASMLSQVKDIDDCDDVMYAPDVDDGAARG